MFIYYGKLALFSLLIKNNNLGAQVNILEDGFLHFYQMSDLSILKSFF